MFKKFVGAAIAALCVSLSAAADRPEIFPQLGHLSVSFGAAYSADGSILVDVEPSGVVVWDVASGRELRRLPLGGRRVAITPDRQRVGVAGEDGFRLWDLPSGRQIAFHASASDLNDIAISPDGTKFLTTEIQKVPQIWDATTGALLRTLDKGGDEAWLRASFTRDGRQVIAVGTHLRVWDAETGATSRVVPAIGLQAMLAMSPDGTSFYTGDDTGRVRRWDLAQLRATSEWKPHNAVINTLALSPDGTLLVTGANRELGAQVWDTATGRKLRTLTLQNRVGNLALSAASVTTGVFSADGRRLMLGGSYEATEWDAQTGVQLRALQGSAGSVIALGLIDGGRQVLVPNFAASASPTMSVWDLTSGRLVSEMTGQTTGQPPGQAAGHARAVNSLAISADGRTAVTGSDDSTIKLWDIATGRVTRTLAGSPGLVFGAIPSPDGKTIYSAGMGPNVLAWDAATGAITQRLPADPRSNTFLALSPDGTWLVSSGTAFNAATLWNTARPDQPRTLTGHRSVIFRAAFSPSGQLLATGGQNLPTRRNAAAPSAANPWDRNLIVWDTATARELFELKGHQNNVTALAFSPDGTQLASADEDGKVIVWDVASRQPVRTLAGHQGAVYALAFTPDGRRMLSGALDSTLRLWDAASGNELLKMIRFNDGEWMSITPQGYFAASSPKAAEKLNVRSGMRVYGINQFYDLFYRPDVVQAQLAGQDTTSMVTLSIDEALANPPPLVQRITLPAGAADAQGAMKVAYTIKSEGGGIGEVRVFHNGKLVKSDGQLRQLPKEVAGRKASEMNGDAIVAQMRGLSRAVVAGSMQKSSTSTERKPELYESSVDIEPVAGDNEVVVVAFNAANTMQSSPGQAGFRSTIAAVPPKLYVLAIGIDEYRDKGSWLKFAAKDARDLSAKWKAQAAGIYGEGNIMVETLLNAQADRAGILAKVNEIAAKVRPSDHFMLFIASHGVLLGDQYYMVTSAYDGQLGPDKLVSSGEIVDFSKRIKALSQLYILDTCHAGGMGGVVNGLYDARMSVLARQMGLHVFASASSAEEALDGYEGNGLFTHALLDGLNNNARADRNADRQVSLTELGAWARRQTGEIAAGLQHRQEPVIIDFGQDNAVYKLR